MSGPSVEQTAEPDDERQRRQWHEARRTEVQEDIDRLAQLGIPARLHWADHIIGWTGFVIVDPVDIDSAVAAAEERGFDRGVRAAGSGPPLAAVRAEAEWRGAEKERERIATEIKSMIDPEPKTKMADARSSAFCEAWLIALRGEDLWAAARQRARGVW